jgi:Do/DeqQ family serine protease
MIPPSRNGHEDAQAGLHGPTQFQTGMRKKGTNMNIETTDMSHRTLKKGLAVLAAGALLTGATWRGLAADSQSAAPAATAATRSITAPAVAGGRDSYADIVKIAAPAVVTIRTQGRARVAPTGFEDGPGDEDLLRRFFGEQFRQGPQQRQWGPRPRQRGLGSGVIVSNDGYILTNFHVVDSAADILVDLTKTRTVKAKLVGSDQPSDLALLKVEADNLQPLALGNSDDVQVGDVVLAVGNPLGIGQTVTMGIVSAKGRSTGVGDGSYEDFLQTDAPINHGNSGGALVNTKGELVGINSQIISNSEGNIGIGFAIPANMARHVMDELRTGGKVRRSQLGVTVQPVTSDMAESLGLKEVGGAIISGVEPGSAAEHAGLKRGDVIKSFNGRAVEDTNTLRNRVAETAPGSTATVVVVRDGSDKEVSVKLDEAAASKRAQRDGGADSDNHAALGVSVAPVTPDLAERNGLGKGVKGLFVQDVDPEGRAAAAGIQAKDVIVEVNRKPVQNVDDLRAALKAASDRPVLLLVSRGGKDLFVTVRAS